MSCFLPLLWFLLLMCSRPFRLDEVIRGVLYTRIVSSHMLYIDVKNLNGKSVLIPAETSSCKRRDMDRQ